MLAQRYMAAVRKQLDFLEQTQLDAVDRGAELVAASVAKGGAVFLSDIGHGLSGDFLNRAGGLALVQHFSYGFNVNDPVPECKKGRPAAPGALDRELETVRLAVRSSNLRPGDVMLIGSVSGRNRGPIELALACREFGVKVIAFTAMDYTKQVTSAHPSGKKLWECADVVLDMGAPFGDGGTEVPGLDFKLFPLSGVGTITLGWMLWGTVVEKLRERGCEPTVFMSINREGGKEYYDKAIKRYQATGY